MSYFDDQSSPAAPFSGDQSGDVFDAPEVVLESPVTTERLVDTQSGFVVVVQNVDSRRSLSVRRRLGTPPTSQIMLTGDESLKLARILADLPLGEPASNKTTINQPDYGKNWGERPWQLGFNSSPMTLRTAWGKKSSLVILCAVFWAALVFGAVLGFVMGHQQHAPIKMLPESKQAVLREKEVDSFLRRFVSDMLDFNPTTYQVSQIRAMAAMSPELVEKYAKDTQFPLDKKKLKALPQGTTVMITKIVQKHIDNSCVVADLYGQMLTVNSKIGAPVHLRLTLKVDQGQILRVVDQKDITASKQTN